MAGLRRRTTFAAPFVITVAAACPSKRNVPPPEEQARTWVVTMSDMKCWAVEKMRGEMPKTGTPPNPPAPQAVVCPPGMASTVTLTIEQQPGKSYCTSRKSVTACPLPAGQELAEPLNIVWMIEKEGSDCHAEELSNCPKGADCNPPKPRTFPCPPGVTEERPLVLAELPDATCVRVPDGCADTGCAREKVACIPQGHKPMPRD